MKKKGFLLTVFLIFTALIQNGCVPKQAVRDIAPVSLTGGSETMLSPEELFEAMAIVATNGEKVQFVLGDNIAGYFETYTFGYKKGQGYIMDSTALYHDFGSYSSGVVNDRTDAEMMYLYPYGFKTVYEEGLYDEFVLHNEEYAVSVSVHSDTAQELSLIPLMNFLEDKVEIDNQGNVVLFSFKNELDVDYPTYVAISADRLFNFTEAKLNKNPEIKSLLKQKANMVKALFTTQEDVTDFTLYVAFGFTADEAAAKANELADGNAATAQKQKIYDLLTDSYLWTDDLDYNRALMWSKISGYSLVSEEFGKGIWAGLPWFKDNWGRDTFIALPGILLVSGQFDDARLVMTNFSTFQNLGQLSVEVQYADDDARDVARSFFKDNFDSSISYRSGNMFPSVSMYYVTHFDELQAAITELTNSTEGLTVTAELIITEDYGRIPNRVTSMDNVIYNTTDGTPWFIREVYDYLRYTGNEAFATEIYPIVQMAIDGAISNYVDENGFLTHDDADTWMDARISGADPWSARGNRADDIQALWYTSLQIGAYLAEYNGESDKAAEWLAIAENLKGAFEDYFWDNGNKILADRVTEDDTADYKIRPNQLMLISIPFEDHLVSDTIESYIVKNAVGSLLYPYGIASLNQEDPYFHPYHENWDYYNKDSAYHNGTVWGWNAGFTVTAMTRFGYTDMAYELTENLTHQILYQGCRGSMSEVMDALQEDKEALNLTGTYSQAWSVSEFARNGYQDYAGFRPNLLENEIDMIPAIPESWNNFDASLAFGTDGQFNVVFTRLDNGYQFEVSYIGYTENLSVNFMPLASDKTRYQFSVDLQPGEVKTVVFDTTKGSAQVDGESVSTSVYLKSYAGTIGELEFVTPDFEREYEMLMGENMLEKIIEQGLFDEDVDYTEISESED